MQTNAALRGEQRRPPNLNHCAVITKAESNPKCRALGIPLERFVIPIFHLYKPAIHLFRLALAKH
ncbi:hypothetical protein FCV50_22930 [Vibrio kanaloae]|uniref:Uncharacterized protein n=1 Tax=Vibrio kanaloae TaxID=170673 RepID=A0A4V5R398_9VIBR|nr:hypothetical protein FCV50_22930 [Vibrio kanaloae]